MLGVALQVSGLVQRVHQDEDGREAAGSGPLRSGRRTTRSRACSTGMPQAEPDGHARHLAAGVDLSGLDLGLNLDRLVGIGIRIRRRASAKPGWRRPVGPRGPPRRSAARWCPRARRCRSGQP